MSSESLVRRRELSVRVRPLRMSDRMGSSRLRSVAASSARELIRTNSRLRLHSIRKRWRRKVAAGKKVRSRIAADRGSGSRRSANGKPTTVATRNWTRNRKGTAIQSPSVFETAPANKVTKPSGTRIPVIGTASKLASAPSRVTRWKFRAMSGDMRSENDCEENEFHIRRAVRRESTPAFPMKLLNERGANRSNHVTANARRFEIE